LFIQEIKNSQIIFAKELKCFNRILENISFTDKIVEEIILRTPDGIRLGRPAGPGKSKLDQFRPEIEALLVNGSSQVFISARFHTTPANLSLWLKKHNIKKPASTT